MTKSGETPSASIRWAVSFSSAYGSIILASSLPFISTVPPVRTDVAAATATWHARCETVLDQLSDQPLVRPDGGWSLLIDTARLGLAPAEASQRLFERGRVAATPMDGWGPSGEKYLRLVFANEPVERLGDLRERFAATF